MGLQPGWWQWGWRDVDGSDSVEETELMGCGDRLTPSGQEGRGVRDSPGLLTELMGYIFTRGRGFYGKDWFSFSCFFAWCWSNNVFFYFPAWNV